MGYFFRSCPKFFNRYFQFAAVKQQCRKKNTQGTVDGRGNYRDNVKVFYCPGGFDYEKMPLPSKLMMKVFTKVLKSKKNKSDYEQEMLKMISSSYDISDKKYIEPIIDALKE